MWVIALLSAGWGIVSALVEEGSPPLEGWDALAELRRGMELQDRGLLEEAAQIYLGVLREGGADNDASKLLGVLRFRQGEALVMEAEELLRPVATSDAKIALAEVLKAQGRLLDAESELLSVIENSEVSEDDQHRATFNLGLIMSQLPQRYGFSDAVELFQRIQKSPSASDAWRLEALLQLSHLRQADGEWERAEQYLFNALQISPLDERATFQHAILLHSMGRLGEAIEIYLALNERGRGGVAVISNLGSALYQQGQMLEARQYFERALEMDSDDLQTLNNYGCLLSALGEHDDAAKIFQKVIQLSGGSLTARAAFINLGTYYAEEGETNKARHAFARANTLRKEDTLLIRQHAVFSPVVLRKAQFEEEKLFAIRGLTELLGALAPNQSASALPAIPTDRVQFYLAYNGANNRDVQELLSLSHALVNPWLRMDHTVSDMSNQHKSIFLQKKIGFVSRYFGEMEPHGMLLQGIMRGLPREVFQVVVCPIVGEGGGNFISKSISLAADVVVPLSLSLADSTQILKSLELDALVFADLTSEPVSHFLGHARFSPVQIAFWGNPMTSGHPSIDYFISGDRLESPRRTQLAEDPYTEMVVLLGGSGIWYDKPPPFERSPPQSSKITLRGMTGISEEQEVLACLQSTYKFHPDFDEAIFHIMRASPNANLVLFEGRRKSWTRVLKERLLKRLGPEIWERLHWIPRVSSHEYLDILASADVAIHPFPFGGSRTSADAIHVGLPLVAMATEALRGRMAASLLTSMGPELVECCVAETIHDYVDRVTSLLRDRAYRMSVKALISERANFIWEDLITLRDWVRFLERAVDATPEQRAIIAAWEVDIAHLE